MMAKVYVVQQQLHKDAFGVLVPKFDLSPAAQFGELVFVCRTDDTPMSDHIDADFLRDQLADITEEDYILPIGSTILMCMVSIIAAEFVPKVNFLYWSGKARRYVSTEFVMEDNDDEA